MSKPGAKSISEEEFSRWVVDLQFLLGGGPVGEKPPQGKYVEVANLVGLKDTSVKYWWSKKTRPTPASAEIVSREAGRDDPLWWKTGRKKQGGKQPDGLVDRLRERCAELGLDSDIVQMILGGQGVGEQHTALPEQLRRAVVAAVHLMGFPLEQVIAEAAELHEETVSAQGKVRAKAIDAEHWYLDLSKRLSGKRPGSGTRPRVTLGDEAKG